MKQFKYVIINSALLYVTTAVLEMILHECSHFLAAFYFDAKELSLHHNFVNYDDGNLSIHQKIWIASAGPMMSLFIGLLFHWIVVKSKKRNSLFLFNVFMSVNGYIGFLGYLMIAPLTTSGDTGFVFHALGFPFWVVILIAIIGLLMLYFIIKNLTKHFVEMASIEIIENKNQRRIFVQAIIQYPIYICVVFMMLLNLPVQIWVSLMPAFSYFSLFYAYGDALNKNYSDLNYNKEFDLLNNIQPAIIIVFVFVVILNRLLVNGFYFH
ncbi:MAG: hypothetical protein U0U67_10525 [Chitinophagales bacterium]